MWVHSVLSPFPGSAQSNTVRLTQSRKALITRVKTHPDMSADDVLWWLYDNYNIVAGTRTIRRVFERKGSTVKLRKGGTVYGQAPFLVHEDSLRQGEGGQSMLNNSQGDHVTQPHNTLPCNSSFAPTSTPSDTAQAANDVQQRMPSHVQQGQIQFSPLEGQIGGGLPEDEETIQLQLQQIALQKRELELRLRMRRLNGSDGRPTSTTTSALPTTPSISPLYDPVAAMQHPPPKRDSRSKKRIAETRLRTAERQERMIRNLERRSRRRTYLTVEWVQSRDLWPSWVEDLLADVMHRYQCYIYSQNDEVRFNAIYRHVYEMVDISKGNWDPHMHDDMLRERIKRKMDQLRAKMEVMGEIIADNGSVGGSQKAANFTSEPAGQAVNALGDREMPADPTLSHPDALPQTAPELHHHHNTHGDAASAAAAAVAAAQMHYEAVSTDAEIQQHADMYNPLLPPHQAGQYPIMQHEGDMLPYTQMGDDSGGNGGGGGGGSGQQDINHPESMVM